MKKIATTLAVVSAAAFLNVFVAEAHGHVVAELGHLEAFEFPVAAVFGDEGGFGHGQAMNWFRLT